MTVSTETQDCTILFQFDRVGPVLTGMSCTVPSHGCRGQVYYIRISQSITVMEGDGVEVRLRGKAFGLYANPIEIGVICTEILGTI